jgi:ribosomal protein L11 methyltransferase
VLAIAAAKLGAASILALDADPIAVRVARENAELNEVSGLVQIHHGSLPGGDVTLARFALDGPLDYFGDERYDLVIVNIVAPVIVGMAAALAESLKPQGWLVTAGLILSQEHEVRQAFRDQGLVIVGRTQEKDWVGLEASRE